VLILQKQVVPKFTFLQDKKHMSSKESIDNRFYANGKNFNESQLAEIAYEKTAIDDQKYLGEFLLGGTSGANSFVDAWKTARVYKWLSYPQADYKPPATHSLADIALDLAALAIPHISFSSEDYIPL
jgi:hypothetical protein